jgi:hypothetical protein
MSHAIQKPCNVFGQMVKYNHLQKTPHDLQMTLSHNSSHIPYRTKGEIFIHYFKQLSF